MLAAATVGSTLAERGADGVVASGRPGEGVRQWPAVDAPAGGGPRAALPPLDIAAVVTFAPRATSASGEASAREVTPRPTRSAGAGGWDAAQPGATAGALAGSERDGPGRSDSAPGAVRAKPGHKAGHQPAAESGNDGSRGTRR